jgi:hypothetical protein
MAAADWSPGAGKPIEALYAWVAVEPDGEGVVAILVGDTWYPLVGADKARIEWLRGAAQDVKRAHGYPVKLVRFDQLTVLEEL